MRQARRTHVTWAAAGALAWAAAVSGCGGGGSADAPTITDLGYTADDITTTDGGTISGDFGFEDPDGNVIELHSRVRSPSDAEEPFATSMLSGIEDATSGRVNFTLNINTLSQPGTWEFDVWVRDADGNDSNELTGTFEVAEGG